MITKVFHSFLFAWRGLLTVWNEEHNFRIEIVVALLVIFSIFYFQFSFIEAVLCIIAMTIVLSAEIINTVIEDLCNKVEPHHDQIIAKIKDTSGAFVLVSVLGAIIVGLLVFYHHFFPDSFTA